MTQAEKALKHRPLTYQNRMLKDHIEVNKAFLELKHYRPAMALTRLARTDKDLPKPIKALAIYTEG